MSRVGLRCTALLALFGAGCFDVTPIAHVPRDNFRPDWRDEIIYQLLTDRFAKGDFNNDFNVDPTAPARHHGGDWQGIIDRLGYLDTLGVTAIWISPVVRNVEEDAGVAGYHGYWTQSFTETNPHFGDVAKLRELVAAAHAHGIKVLLDVVTNHVGQLYFYDINLNGTPEVAIYGTGTTSPVTRVTEYDPDWDPRGIQAFTSLGEAGPAPIVWLYDPAINRIAPEPSVFAQASFFHRRGRILDFDDPVQRELGDFPGGLKDLATERPEVRAALIDAFRYWIDVADIDGYRIDTVKHVEHEFWREFLPAMRRHARSLGKQSFFMFGEIFDGRDDLVGSYTFNEEFESVFYFPQRFRVMDDVFKWGRPTTAVGTLYAERSINYGRTPLTDGTGLAPVDQLVGFIDNHDLPRFLYDRPSTAALRNALFFLFTTDTIPCLYYGTEQDFAGGNDPANREDLWASGYRTDGATFRHIQRLARLRRDLAPLRRGAFQITWETNRTGSEQDAGVLAFERTFMGETVLVVINSNDNQASETSATSLGFGAMPTSYPAGTALEDVFADPPEPFTVGAAGSLTVRVPARSGRILVRRP